MIIAHMPSGYLMSCTHPAFRQFSGWIMLGAILPDLDMLYFYFIDKGAVHHHTYLTHRPAIWLGALFLFGVLKTPRLRAMASGGFLHMVLDTVTGAIAWGWPLWDRATPFVTVPVTQDWWIMSFLLHWSFGLELFICALCMLCYRRGGARHTHPTRLRQLH